MNHVIRCGFLNVALKTSQIEIRDLQGTHQFFIQRTSYIQGRPPGRYKVTVFTLIWNNYSAIVRNINVKRILFSSASLETECYRCETRSYSLRRSTIFRTDNKLHITSLVIHL